MNYAIIYVCDLKVQEIKKSIQEIVQTGHGWFSNQFEEFLQCVFTVDSFQVSHNTTLYNSTTSNPVHSVMFHTCAHTGPRE